jgi:penicillin amidase
VFLGRDNYGDWRARRIRTMLSAAPRPSVVDFAAMQTDVTSAYAAQILPRLRAVPPADALSASALNLLSNWDGAMREDQPQPLIFNAWIAQFRRDVFAQHGLGPTVGAASPPAEFVAFVIAGAETPSGKWWCGGNCDRMLSAALTTATASLGPVYGPDPALWRWGRAHHALFADQALSGIPLLGPLTTAALATGGDDSTVGRAGMAPGSFDAVHGASYRAVYDLADLDRSRFMMAPGQSGNMFAQHARDFLRRWGAGEAITIGPDADHVSATLTVRPAHQAAQR